ncbi:hypothetical protein LUW77_17770 [Streptomyces radiopugnans]|nr:hypothetical protein LUW77_17770 [Streptomyces radiopugnans]
MIETAVSVFQLLFGLLFLGAGWDGWRRPGEASLLKHGVFRDGWCGAAREASR